MFKLAYYTQLAILRQCPLLGPHPGGCKAIPKTVHLFFTADPVGPKFKDLLIVGYNLPLTPDASTQQYKIDQINRGYTFLIKNDL
jgi:hypothetical protein